MLGELLLQSSKTTSIEVTNQLQISEQTEKKIDAAREGYRPSAYRASIVLGSLALLSAWTCYFLPLGVVFVCGTIYTAFLTAQGCTSEPWAPRTRPRPSF